MASTLRDSASIDDKVEGTREVRGEAEGKGDDGDESEGVKEEDDAAAG